MAAAAVQPITTNVQVGLGSGEQDKLQTTLAGTPKAASLKPHDVKTILNYHKENEDGSPPHPTYVDRPETYYRPVESHSVTVRDVTGHEDGYSLDRNGFQFYRHTASEKDFLDDEQIKQGYYKETEQLLKDV
jgi:hypothetical protein